MKLLIGVVLVAAVAVTSGSALADEARVAAPAAAVTPAGAAPSPGGRAAVGDHQTRPGVGSGRATHLPTLRARKPSVGPTVARPSVLGSADAVPGAPTLVSAVPGNGMVTLSWSPPASDGGFAITEYKVYRGTASGGATFLTTTVGPVTGYTDLLASNGTTYYYQVSAVNPSGEGDRSNERSATPSMPATVPGEPFLDSPTVGDGTVALTWITPGSGGSPITGFKVYRGTTSGSKALRATLGVVTEFTDTTAVNGTTYFYEVTAVNAVGESLPSNERSATPIAVPGAPTLDSAIADDASVALAWTAPSANGGAAITAYNVYRSSSGSGEAAVATLDASFTDYTDTTAVNGTTYTYSVRAVNAAGESAKSNELTATPATVPHAPKLDSATAGNGSITLAWSAPSSNGGAAITGYKIYRAVATGSSSLFATVGPVTGYADAPLANGTIYDYRVSAVNAVGEGPQSELRSAVPTAVLFGSPAWWDGDCDANWWNPRASALGWTGEGAHRIGASYLGIPVCGPRPGADAAPKVAWNRPGVAVSEWDAAEFAFRFMVQVYGVTPYAASAANIVRNYSAGAGGGLGLVANGTTGTAPQPGDVVSFDGPGGGLAGVVATVTVDAGGNGEVRLIAQDDSSGGWRRLQMTGWVLLGVGQYVPYAWLHDPAGRGGTSPQPSPGDGDGRPHVEPTGDPDPRPAIPSFTPPPGSRKPPPSSG